MGLKYNQRYKMPFLILPNNKYGIKLGFLPPRGTLSVNALPSTHQKEVNKELKV